MTILIIKTTYDWVKTPRDFEVKISQGCDTDDRLETLIEFSLLRKRKSKYVMTNSRDL